MRRTKCVSICPSHGVAELRRDCSLPRPRIGGPSGVIGGMLKIAPWFQPHRKNRGSEMLNRAAPAKPATESATTSGSAPTGTIGPPLPSIPGTVGRGLTTEWECRGVALGQITPTCRAGPLGCRHRARGRCRRSQHPVTRRRRVIRSLLPTTPSRVRRASRSRLVSLAAPRQSPRTGVNPARSPGRGPLRRSST